MNCSSGSSSGFVCCTDARVDEVEGTYALLRDLRRLVVELEVGLDLFGSVRPLRLHGDTAAVRERSVVDMADVGRRRWAAEERGEELLDRQADSGQDDLLDLVVTQGGDVVLQLPQLDDDVRRHDVRPGRAALAAQREEGEAVAAVGLDERAGNALLAHRLCDHLPERTQPEVERGEAEHDPGRGQQVGDAVGQLRPAQLLGDRHRGDGCKRGAEREQRPHRRGIAGHVEAAPVADERDEQRQRDRRLLDVEALREMRRGRRDDDGYRQLPRAAAAARSERESQISAIPKASEPTRAAASEPGGSTPWTRRTRFAISGVSAETIPSAPTAAAAPASVDSAVGIRSLTYAGYRGSEGRRVDVESSGQPPLPPIPRWVTWLFTLAAVALLPWTLYLTFTLPSRHVTTHYDLAWVGFDIGLAAAFSGTSWAAVRRSRWLIPLAAVTGTMLVCDAWFDVMTSSGAGEIGEAVAEAIFAELPLAGVCAFIVYDSETFLAFAAVALLPWTLYLTFTLPSRHVTTHYDLAWVGFDIGLAAAFSGTSWAAVRRSRWLIPLAAVTGTMLVCDAWFDVMTSSGAGEIGEAVAEAIFAELPLAGVCAFIVYDSETFLRATVNRYADALARRRARL